MEKPRQIASVSLDLDNLWSYMKTHGDPGWERLPSYLDILIPRVLDFLNRHKVRITFFIVGLDADQKEHHCLLRSIPAAGHEVGNHSYHHEPWLHLYSEAAIEQELQRAEEAIETATGVHTNGFRGPGFSFSQTVLNILARRGYRYDASTFPTFLGPLARAYYFANAKNLPAEEMKLRKRLFGKFSEGFRSLKPYCWKTTSGPLLEIPVTTMPLMKIPIHISYILYLARFSEKIAMLYFRLAVQMCQWSGTELSLLLHPLDFLGFDDIHALGFFPAMSIPGKRKVELLNRLFEVLASRFELLPMGEHAERIQTRKRIPFREPGK